MFNPELAAGTQEEEIVQVEETGRVRFYRSLGNWAEFGLYFSGGLLAAFLARLIPGMLIAYGLLMMAIALGLWSWSLNADSPGTRAELLVLAAALLLSCFGGFWDAIWLSLKAAAIMVESNPFWLGAPLVVMVLVGLFLVRRKS